VRLVKTVDVLRQQSYRDDAHCSQVWAYFDTHALVWKWNSNKEANRCSLVLYYPCVLPSLDRNVGAATHGRCTYVHMRRTRARARTREYVPCPHCDRSRHACTRAGPVLDQTRHGDTTMPASPLQRRLDRSSAARTIIATLAAGRGPAGWRGGAGRRRTVVVDRQETASERAVEASRAAFGAGPTAAPSPSPKPVLFSRCALPPVVAPPRTIVTVRQRTAFQCPRTFTSPLKHELLCTVISYRSISIELEPASSRKEGNNYSGLRSRCSGRAMIFPSQYIACQVIHLISLVVTTHSTMYTYIRAQPFEARAQWWLNFKQLKF
jgi:hypothetical protein